MSLNAELAAKIVIPGVPLPLYYVIPSFLPEAKVGAEVSVEIGKRQAQGWIIETLERNQISLNKEIVAVKNKHKQLELIQHSVVPQTQVLKEIIDAKPAFDSQQLKLFQWMSEYYAAPLADIIETAIPKRVTRKTRSDISLTAISAPEIHQLMPAQENACNEIYTALDTKAFNAFLLYGITGSGKTEVYIQTVKRVIATGGSALIIVPEISLTPQLIERFIERLSIPIAVLHSQISPSHRWSAWEALLRGNTRVAIGARSAIFAPIQNLALIIVDEEHDGSYKQSDNVRYHGRDVAVMRAKFENCPIILGSATPSFETLLNVKQKKYNLIELPERVSSRPLPSIEVIDMRSLRKKDLPSANISPTLHHALIETLAAKEQTIILYNRRGFSSYMQCETCGEALSCPHCSVTLTYHLKKETLLCHYCNYSQAAPEVCPNCRNPDVTQLETDESASAVGELRHAGAGTERVFDELSSLFPQARIARMDRDTVGKRGAYAQILGDMRAGKTDILIGTQMIAKGHDLPGVTLVGIIDADVGLHLPDFRSNERTYQLITQAAGRAGRGVLPGKVIVQTREPNHPTLIAAAKNKFKAFARFELERRQALFYPPYGALMRIVISSSDLDQAYAHSMRTSQFLIVRQTDHTFSFLGPAPAPIERLRNRFRWHILLKAPSRKTLAELSNNIRLWHSSLARSLADVRLTIDIDPVDML